MGKKLILHDLSVGDTEALLSPCSSEYILFDAAPPVHHCVGCFGCWIKTPGRCIIADRAADFAGLMAGCDEIIVISRMTFGGLSPGVKAVLDRSIGIVLPHFRDINVRRPAADGAGGSGVSVREMHHAKRHDISPDLRYLFYGEDITEDERVTAERLTAANLINFGFGRASAGFFRTAAECVAALKDADAYDPATCGVANGASGYVITARRSANAATGIPAGDPIQTAMASDPMQTSKAGDAPERPSAGGGGRAKIAFINGSPKPARTMRFPGSISIHIIEALEARTSGVADCATCNIALQERGEIIETMTGRDALVFVFPLYVDGIPSHMLRFLSEAREDIAAAAPGATVYAVLNNGFYEGGQNAVAFEMMRSFTVRAGLKWGQGVGIGAGPLTQAAPIGHGPARNLSGVMDTLAANIEAGSSAADRTAEPNFPRFLYTLAAHHQWRKAIRKNNLPPKRLYDK
jgi:multimeric flavodoxin WrbA